MKHAAANAYDLQEIRLCASSAVVAPTAKPRNARRHWRLARDKKPGWSLPSSTAQASLSQNFGGCYRRCYLRQFWPVADRNDAPWLLLPSKSWLPGECDVSCGRVGSWDSLLSRSSSMRCPLLCSRKESGPHCRRRCSVGVNGIVMRPHPRAARSSGPSPAGWPPARSRRVAGITSPAGRPVEQTGAVVQTARPHGHRRPAKVARDVDRCPPRYRFLTPFAADLRSTPTAARPRASAAARCPLG
jgi:hypothetical protein